MGVRFFRQLNTQTTWGAKRHCALVIILGKHRTNVHSSRQSYISKKQNNAEAQSSLDFGGTDWPAKLPAGVAQRSAHWLTCSYSPLKQLEPEPPGLTFNSHSTHRHQWVFNLCVASPLWSCDCRAAVNVEASGRYLYRLLIACRNEESLACWQSLGVSACCHQSP